MSHGGAMPGSAPGFMPTAPPNPYGPVPPAFHFPAGPAAGVPPRPATSYADAMRTGDGSFRGRWNPIQVPSAAVTSRTAGAWPASAPAPPRGSYPRMTGVPAPRAEKRAGSDLGNVPVQKRAAVPAQAGPPAPAGPRAPAAAPRPQTAPRAAAGVVPPGAAAPRSSPLTSARPAASPVKNPAATPATSAPKAPVLKKPVTSAATVPPVAATPRPAVSPAPPTPPAAALSPAAESSALLQIVAQLLASSIPTQMSCKDMMSAPAADAAAQKKLKEEWTVRILNHGTASTVPPAAATPFTASHRHVLSLAITSSDTSLASVSPVPPVMRIRSRSLFVFARLL